MDGCVKAGMARWCKNLRDKLEEKTNKLMEKVWLFCFKLKYELYGTRIFQPTGALRGGGPVSKVGNETNEVLGSKLPEIGQEQEQLDAERDEDSEVVDDGEVARGNNAIEALRQYTRTTILGKNRNQLCLNKLVPKRLD